MKRIIYIIFCTFLISCGQYNAELENALKLAGENRGELEKVLYHYSQNPSDSLKLQAATFLIENMPGHYLKQCLIVTSLYPWVGWSTWRCILVRSLNF